MITNILLFTKFQDYMNANFLFALTFSPDFLSPDSLSKVHCNPILQNQLDSLPHPHAAQW